MPKIYLSGPMSGIKNYNALAFYHAESALRVYGWGDDIINPIALDDHDPYTEENKTGVWKTQHRNRYLRRDIMLLADPQQNITHIYMLQGWEKSRGARLEKKIAEELGLYVVFEKKYGAIPKEVTPPWIADASIMTSSFLRLKDGELRWTTRPGGYKADENKLPMDLLPFDAIEAVAKILQHGAKKYQPRNWEAGMKWSRPYNAALRHLFAWGQRKDTDSDSGLPALAHAACSVLFLLAYELRKIGEDDRPTHRRTIDHELP
jgi:hypothetical protein